MADLVTVDEQRGKYAHIYDSFRTEHSLGGLRGAIRWKSKEFLWDVEFDLCLNV